MLQHSLTSRPLLVLLCAAAGAPAGRPRSRQRRRQPATQTAPPHRLLLMLWRRLQDLQSPTCLLRTLGPRCMRWCSCWPGSPRTTPWQRRCVAVMGGMLAGRKMGGRRGSYVCASSAAMPVFPGLPAVCNLPAWVQCSSSARRPARPFHPPPRPLPSSPAPPRRCSLRGATHSCWRCRPPCSVPSWSLSWRPCSGTSWRILPRCRCGGERQASAWERAAAAGWGAGSQLCGI